MKNVEKTIQILKELSGMEEVKPENHLQQDCMLDSLAMVTLLLEIEEAFEIELEEADMNPMHLTTVQDVLDLVEMYCGESHE